MPATPAEIARRALADHLTALPPAQLLARYASRRDPEAFAGLVHQFGPLVFGACRRVLGATADADDAFQAVFLALARQAGSFRDARALPAWLHRVSLRIARKALARRGGAVPLPEAADPADPFADVAWRDVRRVLDEEIDALPGTLRGPVVLCWLDGLTQDEAADRLGLSLNTLKRRLDAGRAFLRSRLTRRGLAPVLAAAIVETPAGLRAVVPEALKVLAGESGVGGPVSERVLALAAPAPTRRVVLASLLGAGTAVAGGIAYALMPPRRPPSEVPVADAPQPRPAPGPLRFEPIGEPVKSPGVLWPQGLTFTPDGRTLILTEDRDGIDERDFGFRLWELGGKGPARRKFERSGGFHNHTNVVVRPGGRQLLTGVSVSPTIQIWDLKTGTMRVVELESRDTSTRNSDLVEPFVGWLRQVALSPDGNTLATADNNGRAFVWDVSDLWTPPPRKPGEIPSEKLRDPRFVIPCGPSHDGISRTLAFSPDGTTLATAYSPVPTSKHAVPHLRDATVPAPPVPAPPRPEGFTTLWDVATGREKDRLGAKLQVPALNSVAFSPDGRYLALCGVYIDRGTNGDRRPYELKVWDLTAGTERTLASGLNGFITAWPHEGFGCLEFHPDSRALLAGNGNALVQWDVETGRKLGTTPLEGGVFALALSPDGRTLATSRPYMADRDREAQVRLWRVDRPT